MVTKPCQRCVFRLYSLILAKIHMVTKHEKASAMIRHCLILAKIHMVTKLGIFPVTTESVLF